MTCAPQSQLFQGRCAALAASAEQWIISKLLQTPLMPRRGVVEEAALQIVANIVARGAGPKVPSLKCQVSNVTKYG